MMAVEEVVSDALRGTVLVGLTLAGLVAVLIWIKNRTIRVSYLRAVVQIASVVTIFTTLLFLAQWPSILVLAIIIAPLLVGRVFCGWVCPFGLYMDAVTFLRKRLKIKYWNLPEKANKYLHNFRYVLAASVLTLPLFYGALDPNVWGAFAFFKPPFLPLNIFFLGPLEPLVIPSQMGGSLVLTKGWNLSYPYTRGFLDFLTDPLLASILAIVLVAITLAASFKVRRFWCRFCPTGVSAAAVNKFKGFDWAPILRINKAEEKCTKCGICKRVCPLQVTEVYEQKGGDITTQMCMLCLRCVEMCPYEDCLKVNMAGKTLFKSRNWLEPTKVSEKPNEKQN